MGSDRYVLAPAMLALAPLLLAGGCGGGTRTAERLPLVQPNDNRRSAGTMRGDTLVVRLSAQMARWYPEDSTGPFADVAAFSEGDGPPQIPAPLLRAPQGATLRLTVINRLADSTLWVHGLTTRPAAGDDSLGIAPGDSARLVFPAGAVGTYAYLGWPGRVDHDEIERETLGGALVIDSAGARTDDRVFVMNIWGDKGNPIYRNALAINGRSWPFTERITANPGDTLRWRWVNATIRSHPMHLHGFYFRVDARGTGLSDSIYTPAGRRLAVTEVMDAASTMAMTWVPERDGNWLFHCHIGFHVTPEAQLDPTLDPHVGLSHDANVHMAGLVLGIDVRRPTGWSEPSRENPRRLRLHVQEGRQRGRSRRALGFVLQRDDRPPAADSVEIPGATLVLHAGEPTDITVVNHLAEATAVHWHGIELESYSDGVAGWSGSAMRAAPAIAPSDSFVARLTLPRTGTFIYHTHLNDIYQLTSGLYGAIVVLPRGRSLDPAVDHLFVAGWDGGEDPPHLLINGDSVSKPLTLKRDVVHRFRFVNIGVAASIAPSLMLDSTHVAWRIVARDGAELPPSQVHDVRTQTLLDVGQTADFTWRPESRGGRYAFAIWSAGRANYHRIPITVR